MNTRTLRTHAPVDLNTMGRRIRFARLENKMSQADLALQVARRTGKGITKSLVSQWERDSVANPQNANLHAIAIATNFNLDWLIHGGKYPQRMGAKQLDDDAARMINVERLARAVDAVIPGTPNLRSKAAAIASIYDLLTHSPDIPDAIISSVATRFNHE